MEKKQFQTESKKLLDMMVNSIYTHKEIFLRELISNASDALDKLYYRALTDETVKVNRDELCIVLAVDENKRELIVADNGCGMTETELEENLGVIAKSGSFDFKQDQEKREDVDIIGQFGVGFYSAFMVADHITVESLAYGAKTAYRWESDGADGYTVEPCTCDIPVSGTVIRLHLREDTENEDEKYSDYLKEFKIRSLVKKYSDYIRFPIRMEVSTQKRKEDAKDDDEDAYETVRELQTLNSMVPLWKKNPSQVNDDEYHRFYQDKFFDFEAPLHKIHIRAEGAATYEALLYIPVHAPYNYYTTEYQKGLQLYSSGVMIMERCQDLLPDYFGFVRGLVDSADLSLNISRELLQHDRQLKVIARAIEKKVRTELEKMMENNREQYETFFRAFGLQIKYGLYADYGAHKDDLKDLVLFYSGKDKKPISLKEYVSRMPEEQKAIYYSCGENTEKISRLPQVESVLDRGFDVLYLTDDVDEFALKMLNEYDSKKFANVSTEALDVATDEEKQELAKKNESAKELLDFMKETLQGEVSSVRLVNTLKDHPVSLSSEEGLSLEMEKVLNKMPGAEEIGNRPKATLTLELNATHPLTAKLLTLFATDREKTADYTHVLYAQARLIHGMPLSDPSAYTDTLCRMLCE